MTCEALILMTRNKLGFQGKPLKVGLEALEQSLQQQANSSVSAFKLRADQSLWPGSGGSGRPRSLLLPLGRHLDNLCHLVQA
jgi:hypothetical protein